MTTTLRAWVCLSGALGSWGAAGCAADGGGGSAPATGADAVATVADVAANTPGGTPAPTCTAAASPVGAIATPQADVIYQNGTAEASATHLAAGGCVTSLAASFTTQGGCALSLTFASEAGVWKLSDGQLKVDSACGEAWTADLHGDYALEAEASTGAVTGLPAAKDGAPEDCLKLDGTGLMGKAHFVLAKQTVDVNLAGLSLTGTVRSMAAEGGSCPAPVVACADIGCGEDAYGSACGGCGDGLQCVAGQCAESNCPPTGPFGYGQSDTVTDVTLKDCDGNEHTLHELCGENAGFIYLLAGW